MRTVFVCTTSLLGRCDCATKSRTTAARRTHRGVEKIRFARSPPVESERGLAMKLVVLAFAAFAAGFVNAVGGGGSLIAFPALLAFGYADVAANVTTTVSLWPGYVGGGGADCAGLQGQRGGLVPPPVPGGGRGGGRRASPPRPPGAG